jgi:membrane-associated protease RseP (regulator of RpoE activity)
MRVDVNVNDLSLWLMMGLMMWVWVSHCRGVTNTQQSDDLSLSPSEEAHLKNCFPNSIYGFRGLEYRSQHIYCYGKLRSRNLKYAYELVSRNIQEAFGDRFTCYLQEIPMMHSGAYIGHPLVDDFERESPLPNYCFYLQQKETGDRPQKQAHQSTQDKQNKQLISQPTGWLIMSISSMILTAAILIIVGANSQGIVLTHLSWQGDQLLPQLLQGIPYAVGVMSILIGRVIATYYITKKYHIPFTPPIYLPWPNELGILSSLNPIPSPHLLSKIGVTQQRKIIFDLAAYPHITGILLSLLLLLLGNWLSIPSQPSSPNILNISFHSSILILAIHKGVQTIAPISEFLSPLSLAGWTGLMLNAMQLLPWQFLDGHNLYLAMYSHQQTLQIARISRLVILAIAVIMQPWLRVYSLLLFILPLPRPLIFNEGIEINRNRDYLGLMLMAIALLSILPAPKFMW